MSLTVTYTDGAYTTAVATSAPVYESPLPHTSARLVLRQKFCIAKANFAALPLNTEHPTDTSFVLVAEGPETDLGNGIIEWERVYAKVPDDFTEHGGTYTYHFIGFIGVWGVNVDAVTGRERFTKNVPVQITHEFFLIGTSGGGLGTPDYATAEDIPTEDEQKYYYGSTSNLEVDYIADSPPLVEATSPSRTEYEDLIDDDEFNIVVEKPSPVRWMGNIWQVSTMRIKAQ